jgi:hypothetical protein
VGGASDAGWWRSGPGSIHARGVWARLIVAGEGAGSAMGGTPVP